MYVLYVPDGHLYVPGGRPPNPALAVTAPGCQDPTVLPAAAVGPDMKVLLGIGGADDSLQALERVVERTRETGDDLTVAVLDNPEADATPGAVERQVDDALADAGLAASVAVRRLDGEPGPALVELAESGGFDRLVLGGGQRSPMGKITLGRVAEYVLLNGRVSVTLIR